MDEITQVRITKSTMDSIGDALREKRNEETLYLPSEMPTAIRGIQPVLQEKTATENGDILPDAGYDGLSVVHVNVSGGGSGSGPVYSGTSVPASSLGSNEDLYIQYEVMSGTFDHTYKIIAQFRKVDGIWTQYTIPEKPTKGVHIWTKSTGGTDASMYVQAGYWDADNDTFVTTGEAEIVIYSTVGSWNTAKDCNGVALLSYQRNWAIKASTTITDGTSVYQADETVTSWGYTIQKDIYLWKP